MYIEILPFKLISCLDNNTKTKVFEMFINSSSLRFIRHRFFTFYLVKKAVIRATMLAIDMMDKNKGNLGGEIINISSMSGV